MHDLRSAVWVKSCDLRNLDVRLPIWQRLPQQRLEVVPRDDGVDLVAPGTTIHCGRAMESRSEPPEPPEPPKALFSVQYPGVAFRQLLKGDPDVLVELRRELEDPWRAWLDGKATYLMPTLERDTTHFGGWAQRGKLRAVLADGAERMDLVRLRGGWGVMTSVERRVARADVTITRLVLLTRHGLSR